MRGGTKAPLSRYQKRYRCNTLVTGAGLAAVRLPCWMLRHPPTFLTSCWTEHSCILPALFQWGRLLTRPPLVLGACRPHCCGALAAVHFASPQALPPTDGTFWTRWWGNTVYVVGSSRTLVPPGAAAGENESPGTTPWPRHHHRGSADWAPRSTARSLRSRPRLTAPPSTRWQLHLRQ